MSWLVIGKSGQVSTALSAARPDLMFWGRAELDLSAPDAEIKACLKTLPRCDGVILTAAYTAVDKAESEPELAMQVNCTAPRLIAQACAVKGLPLIYLSTDYVFDGKADKPYKVTAAKNPINIYGRSKAEGEDAVMRVHGRATILRTSGVFSATGKNFVTTMLSLRDKPQLSIVNDQLMRPTYAGTLAAGLGKLMDASCHDIAGQIYHLTGSGSPVSWADFASHIFSATKLSPPPSLLRISSAAYGAPAARPAYSVLDISGFEATMNYTIPDAMTGVSDIIEQIL